MFKIGKKTQKKSFKTQFLHGYFFCLAKKTKTSVKNLEKNAQFTRMLLLR